MKTYNGSTTLGELKINLIKSLEKLYRETVTLDSPPSLSVLVIEEGFIQKKRQTASLDRMYSIPRSASCFAPG